MMEEVKQELKKEIKRSNAYPSISIEEAVKLSELIYKNSGTTFIHGNDIAKLLNKTLGGITSKISSCVQYGFLELKSNTGYKGTELLKKILRPINEEEKRASLIEAFQRPKLYKELLEKYGTGPIPSDTVLPNILDRQHNIFEGAANKASEIFFQNVSDLNLLNEHREINLSSAPKPIEEKPQEILDTPIGHQTLQKNSPGILKPENNNLIRSTFPLGNERECIFYYPADLNEDDFDLIEHQISYLKLLAKKNKKVNPEVDLNLENESSG